MSDIERERMRDTWGYLPTYSPYLAHAPYGAPRAPHLGHSKHLCHLAESGADLDEYKGLVKNAKFVCKVCGRAAAKAENLCEPVAL
jgi:hypothetical protein